MRPIEYIDYDKISDDVLYLGSKLFLRMNVSLSDKGDQNVRYHFHREFMYESTYAPNNKFVSIKRSFNYYLSLDRPDIPTGGIMIRPQDMYLLKSKLEAVSLWFAGNTFGIKDKKLFIRVHQEPIIIDGLASQKYLQFDPVVFVWENTGEQTPGVRIILGDPSIFADISADKFFALLYTISSFNMYMSAQLLLNYIGRPNYGFNMMEIERNTFLEEKEDGLVNAKENRQIRGKKNKSFFDTLDGMMNEEE